MSFLKWLRFLVLPLALAGLTLTVSGCGGGGSSESGAVIPPDKDPNLDPKNSTMGNPTGK